MIERENDEAFEGLNETGLAEIASIQAASLRIEAGAHGMCVRCGEDIAPRRFEVLPQSTLCINCDQRRAIRGG